MAGLHADRQTNMQMNQPVWFVEDRKLMSNEEGKKKLQEVADANSKSQQRLTIAHGSDFDKASRACLPPISCCGNALAKGKAVLLCIICMTHHPETVATRPHKHLAHFWQTSVNHYFSLRPILCGS
jgi:hypothetical protein